MKLPATHIVLLGGGNVSVSAYRALLKHLRPFITTNQVRITVISPHTAYTFTSWRAELVKGVLSGPNRQIPLASLLPEAQLIYGKAKAINTDWHVVDVELADGSDQLIRYDHLLLGMGVYDNDTIAGVDTYGFQLSQPHDFQRTKDAITQLVQRAALTDTATAQQLLTFTVVGGGIIGVELVANLAEYIRILKKEYPSLRTVQQTIHLIHSGERILTELQPDYDRLVQHAEKTLQAYSVEVITNRIVTRVIADGAFLDDYAFIASSMVIFTIGQRMVQLKGMERMCRDEQQRLYTNAYLQLIGLPNVWIGGDACHVMQAKTATTRMVDADGESNHGQIAGTNIALAIQKKPLQSFLGTSSERSASLGRGKGIAAWRGLQFTGPLAWLIRWFSVNRVLLSRPVQFPGLGNRSIGDEQRPGQEPQQPNETIAPSSNQSPTINELR